MTARAGHIHNRSGDPYKPSAIRAYEQNARLRILPAPGTVRLGDLRHRHLQAFVDELVANGAAPATVMTTMLPLRAIYRRAHARGIVADNPTRGIETPAVRSRRDRIASPREAEGLLAALEPQDRPLWATALYAGLRRGELTALHWEDVNLATGRSGLSAAGTTLRARSPRRAARAGAPFPRLWCCATTCSSTACGRAAIHAGECSTAPQPCAPTSTGHVSAGPRAGWRR